jgi:hypothetical protein
MGTYRRRVKERRCYTFDFEDAGVMSLGKQIYMLERARTDSSIELPEEA